MLNYTYIYFSLIVKKAILLIYTCPINSWHQPVESIMGTVSCSRKQR